MAGAQGGGADEVTFPFIWSLNGFYTYPNERLKYFEVIC